jgi:hypothetical protein
MKLASAAPIEDGDVRRDEKRRRLQRFYRPFGIQAGCAASNPAAVAGGRAGIIANLSASASMATRSLSVAENKAGFVSLTGD